MLDLPTLLAFELLQPNQLLLQLHYYVFLVFRFVLISGYLQLQVLYEFGIVGQLVVVIALHVLQSLGEPAYFQFQSEPHPQSILLDCLNLTFKILSFVHQFLIFELETLNFRFKLVVLALQAVYLPMVLLVEVVDFAVCCEFLFLFEIVQIQLKFLVLLLKIQYFLVF